MKSTSFDSWDYDSTLQEYAADFEKPEASNAIPVTVSGQLYFLEPHLFDKLRRLPWTVPSPTTSFFSRLPRSSTPIQYSLRTAPYLFDILVNYVQSGSLPDLTTLRTADLEELEPLVMLLQLPVLQKHLQLQQWGIRMSSVSSLPHQEAPARLWKAPARASGCDNDKNYSNENLESVAIKSAEYSLGTASIAPPQQQKHMFLPKIRRNSSRPKKDAMLGDATEDQLKEIEGNSIDIAAILPNRRNRFDKKKKSQSERSFLDRKNTEQSRPGFLQKIRQQSERRMSHAEVCASSDLIN